MGFRERSTPGVSCEGMAVAVTFSKGQNRLVRQLARRRLYLFFFGLYLVTAVTSFNERTTIRRVASLIAFAAMLVAVLVIVLGWRRRTLKNLEHQHRIILLLVLIIAATVAVNFHFPSLVFTFLLVVNWFV